MPFKWNPFTGTLDLDSSSGSAPPPSIDDNVFIEFFTLNATQAADKEVILQVTPTDSDKIFLDIIGGSSQKVGSDFQVVGNVLSWDGLALETILEENDDIRVQYYI